MPGGRPTKLTPKMLDRIKTVALLPGSTDARIAFAVDIDESTLNRWKTKHPEFCKSLKRWKTKADADVERSLYERATGYSHPDTKPQWVSDENGGHWEYAEMTKHYPPDPTSCIFWLKNRKPDVWRDKTEHGFTDKEGNDLTWRIETVAANADDTDT